MFRRPVKERFIVLAISAGQALDTETENLLSKTIEFYKPTCWQLYNSSNFHVYFRLPGETTVNRAKELYEAAVDLIKQDEKFAQFRIGITEGMLISKVNHIGGVTFDHLGATVQDAYKLQKGKSELTDNAPPGIS